MERNQVRKSTLCKVLLNSKSIEMAVFTFKLYCIHLIARVRHYLLVVNLSICAIIFYLGKEWQIGKKQSASKVYN
jgi:hypothetical protein